MDRNIGILSTGSYLPKREVGNDEVAERVGVTPEWIERKTQILSRRYAAPHEATSDLAVRAGTQALEQAGLSADQIDYIIVSTSTGDFPQPPTSYLVQHGLGAYSAACFDVNVVCSGFVYALALARSLVAVSPDSRVLVIGADLYSRILDFGDRRTAVLFADGAGAAVVGSVPAPHGILGIDLASRGDAHHLIRVEAGGSRNPATAETVADGGHFFRMDGRAVRDFVADNVPPALVALARRVGVTLPQVNHFVPHQANGVMLGEVVERAGLGNAHTHRTLRKYGNVGSASVPVALDEAHRGGALSPGDLVLLAGFGGGMAIGASLLTWGAGA
ncbi:MULTISPECIES: 3-oxoacyl-ACP synthase III family protein [unclassified Streptomyces]|uniref:3-oxoacyl-ACP synthase III family protein n=1 Tax=unclassified Streptomyces TaxID=2593676 RepID=UPI001F04EBFB|nr:MULTISPECIES: ketoacyl-ACP synthase III [unclassified Streptomyces]MCH0567476.1 ketoacyl-ACP synthase III [Streptomyces sp. MUM 2J]MCH0570916.1 ketoacyl-ACP synthase III [Streptomyces sp. MUM 136J]